MTERSPSPRQLEPSEQAIERVIEAIEADERVTPILAGLRDALRADTWSAAELERLFREAAEGGRA